MNSEKLQTYNQLNSDQKEVMGAVRQMKLMGDQARFELFSYQLALLLEKYQAIMQLRKETQALLFEVLEKIEQNNLSAIDIDYYKLGKNRINEENTINEEVNIVEEYKIGFDEALDLIYSGVAEQILMAEDEIDVDYT